jgi:hypothetical protein
MGKLRQWVSIIINRWMERSMQRTANRLFDKSQIQYKDGDNT